MQCASKKKVVVQSEKNVSAVTAQFNISAGKVDGFYTVGAGQYKLHILNMSSIKLNLLLVAPLVLIWLKQGLQIQIYFVSGTKLIEWAFMHCLCLKKGGGTIVKTVAQ